LFFAINKGKTIIIDKFDASIHPMALMNIVNIFHNPEINLQGGQLIFATHNPIFLNKHLMRRDEIKFIEYNNEKLTSFIYSLADFKTNGKIGVRNSDDYMKDYFKTKYGAIQLVDLEPLFEKNSHGTANEKEDI
jgi:AAA15 family ATPase/GTPase